MLARSPRELPDEADGCQLREASAMLDSAGPPTRAPHTGFAHKRGSRARNADAPLPRPDLLLKDPTGAQLWARRCGFGPNTSAPGSRPLINSEKENNG